MYKQLLRVCFSTLLTLPLIGIANVAAASEGAADRLALLDKYDLLASRLARNQFKQPLALDSVETPSRLAGDVYAVVDHRFSAVSTALNDPDNWCDVMLLHINTKYCRATTDSSGSMLKVHIGRKTPEALADAPRVDFRYKTNAATSEYLDVALNARTGPLGTSDYNIQMQAVALPDSRTFIHLSYSYATSFAGRMAMKTYLGTIGRDKVGFTVMGKQADGSPEHIGGVRGVVERNTMRYYLAIDSFLAAASAAPSAQLEKRLNRWFMAVERYPVQLHEMDKGTYLAMKRAEHTRQQTVQ